jgi:hypothetical protein
MPGTIEALQPEVVEVGSDQNKEAELVKIEEKPRNDGTRLYESDTPGFSPGEEVFPEYRLPPQILGLRRPDRYVGRQVVGLTLRHSPIRGPLPQGRAHIKEVRPLN